MSDSVVFERRDFLKLVGVGIAGTAAGCASHPSEKLIPYLIAPEDVLPGVPYFYSTACRECPAGCGMVVRSREGRAIKLEGNPQHPLGQGGLCARGQAGLQGLYDPDRIKTPLVRDGKSWKSVTWDEALALVAGKLQAAKGKTVLLTGHETGTLRALAGEFASAHGATHVMWEPFGYETLRAGNRATFGIDAVPHFDVAAARCVIAFGADFLETFGSPVAQARGFAAMRANRADGAGHFITVEPRLSTTGANADEWVAAKPGTEFALALGLANVICNEGLGSAGAERAALKGAVAAYTPEAVAAQTEVPAETIVRLARLFAKTGPSLALAGGIATQGTNGVALVAAVNLLNHVAGNTGRTVRFDRTLDLSGLATFAEFQSRLDAMAAGQVELLLVNGANPVYALPAWTGAADAIGKVPFKVAFATAKDETTELCDVILPVSHALESFGDAFSARGVYSLQQPAMRRLPMFDSRPLGDALIADLAQHGVDVRGERRGRTGSIVVVATADGTRTMLTDRGSATELSVWRDEWLDGANVVHLPLYSFSYEPLAETARRAVASANASKIFVSLDLSSVALIEHLGATNVQALLRQTAPDVLFCTRAEAESAGVHADDLCGAGLIVVKDAERPIRVFSGRGKETEFPVQAVERVVDATGAGDAFAAGFLSQFAECRPVEACVSAGRDLAARVVKLAGATLEGE